MSYVKNWRDLFGGSLLAAVGLMAAYLSKGLAFGSVSRMAAGFMPFTLSWCVVCLGVVVLLRSVVVNDDPPAWPKLRPFVFVCLGPILFALLIGPLGLVLTIMLVTMFVRFATPQKLTIRAIVFPITLSAACAVVFVYVLNLSIPVWP